MSISLRATYSTCLAVQCARASRKEECRRELQDTKRQINLYRDTKSVILGQQHTVHNVVLDHSPAQALGAAAPGQSSCNSFGNLAVDGPRFIKPMPISLTQRTISRHRPDTWRAVFTRAISSNHAARWAFSSTSNASCHIQIYKGPAQSVSSRKPWPQTL